MGDSSKHERTLYVLGEATKLIERALVSKDYSPLLVDALMGLNELMMGLEVEAEASLSDR